jgi:NAD(P)-dependent dehydrogenase (short-subunit alcohol dehydrogenase family)
MEYAAHSSSPTSASRTWPFGTGLESSSASRLTAGASSWRASRIRSGAFVERLRGPHPLRSEAMIAVVTGAGSGIGRAAAKALLSDGWSVVAAGRREAPLRETLTGADGLAVPTDVTDPDSVAALFEAARERYGRVDLLFNNAGLNLTAPVAEVTLEDWRRVVDTNLTGAFLCAQAAFRMMAAQHPRGGRIINNGSLSAYVPRPFAIAYNATKHAVTGLTKSLSLEGRAYDIACGQLDIGNAATEMTERMSEGVAQADGSLAAEPRMDVEHAGRAVAHMASLPLDANVQFMTVMATKMPYIGRG